MDTIEYKTGTATCEQVLKHLRACDENFFPKLSEKINLETYSNKVVKNSVTFEAWNNGELTGLVAAYFNDPGNKTGFITNVSTMKPFFGRGIASQLLKNCIAYARSKKYETVLLEVAKNNETAVSLYKKLNFFVIDEKNNLLTMKTNL